VGINPICGAFGRRGLNPVKLAYDVHLRDVHVNQQLVVLTDYTSDPADKLHCYTELCFFFPGSDWNIIASSRRAYLWSDGQAELARVVS